MLEEVLMESETERMFDAQFTSSNVLGFHHQWPRVSYMQYAWMLQWDKMQICPPSIYNLSLGIVMFQDIKQNISLIYIFKCQVWFSVSSRIWNFPVGYAFPTLRTPVRFPIFDRRSTNQCIPTYLRFISIDNASLIFTYAEIFSLQFHLFPFNN